MNTNLLIEARNVLIKHGKKVALKGFDFELAKGSVTALLGRNGAGKSSFLDACMGLIPPSEGEIRVFGMNPMKEGPKVRQRVGYVEADPYFEAHEKVAHALQFAFALRSEIDVAFRDELVRGMKIPLDSKVSELSRGQRTKLALCLALTHQPELLIFDEPFDGLDAGARHEILAAIIRQVDDSRGIVIASHDLDEIERVADRIAIIHDYKIVLQGSLEEVCQQVRRWIGVANAEACDMLRSSGFQVETRGDEVMVCTLDGSAPELASLKGCEKMRPLPVTTLEEVFLAATPQDREGAGL